MAEANTTRIRIEADGTMAIEGIGKVDVAMGRMGTRTSSVFSQMRAGWVAYTAVAYASAASMQKAWDLMNASMKVEAQIQMMDRLSKKYATTGDEIVHSLQTASNSMISRADAAQVATKGIFAGLNPTQLTDLMQITGAAARANGITIAEAYEKIAQAAETGRTRSLKQMGIIVDLTRAHEDYARRLNTTAANLTEEEKMVASVNAILAKQGPIMAELGGPSDNLRTKILQQKAAWADLKTEVGGVLAQLSSAAFRGFSALAESFGKSEAQADMPLGGAGGSWGDKPPDKPFIRPTDLGPGLQAMLGALSKFYADSERIRKEAEAQQTKDDQAVFESRLGLEREYLRTGIVRIDEIRRRTAAAYKEEKRQKEEILRIEERRIEFERRRVNEKFQGMDNVSGMAMDMAAMADTQNITKGVLGLFQTGKGMDPYSQQLENLRLFYEQKKILYQQGEASLFEVFQASRDVMLSADKLAYQQRLMDMQSYTSIASGLLTMANNLTEGKYKVLYLAMQGMSAAQAIIHGYSAAAAAVAPPPIGVGPLLGPALASKMIGFGYFNAASIMAQGIGRMAMSGSGGGGSSGGGASSSLPALPAPAPAKEETKPSVSVNVHIYGNVVDQDKFARELVPAITKAMEDNVK